MIYIIKPALALFIAASIVIALLSFVHQITEEPILQNQERIQEAAMREVLPQADDFELIRLETTGNIRRVLEGRQNGQLIGYVFELSPEGYSGNIDMMVGIYTAENVVSGMRILRHTETPGLGALATQEKFYRKFDNRPLSPLTVVKVAKDESEIDAITSSTITTKAITNAVNEAIEYVKGVQDGFISH